MPLRTSARIRKSASSGQLADSKNSIPPAEIRSTANRGTPVARDSSSLNRASRLHFMQISTPVTPSVSIPKPDEGFSDDTMDGRRDTSTRPAHFIITPETDSKEFSRTISPKVEGAEGRRAQAPACSQDSFSSVEGHVTPTSAGTQDSRVQDRSRSHTRPRPAALDTAAGQDGSLPSPSLSPVTAAASLQSRRSYFEEQGPTAPSSATGLTFSPKSEPDSWTLPSEEADHEYRNIDTSMQVNGDEVGQSTMMDLPDMLDSFDAMPLEMKTYVMFQLLRRCPKPVLHFVADQVNPALKCDFLTLLPPELAQNVISYLDLRSLCRASQVSKKWRQIIDTDERAWKTLFDASGFEATTEEMQRAVQEGWGWQSGVSHDDPERDLSGFDSRTSSERLQSPAPLVGMAPHPAAASEMRSTVTPAKRGSKRKIGSKAKASNRKLQKKHETGVEEVAFFDEESLKRHLASNEGPYAAAQAALIAVPSPPVGLPSIRNLHLYKSLYRRHHLIRSYWTNDHVPPRHTAFKAHHRHVVTCLQFDSDKILTGSDDTNINVYDTRTGALLQRLDGHEGGVWALQYRGNTLVSGSTDRSVRVWDIAHGKCTHVFQGHTSTVRCLIILIPTVIGRDAAGRDIVMPKEPIVITGSRDSTLRIWKLPPAAEPPESSGEPKIDPGAPHPAGTPQPASTDTNTSTTSARNTDTDSVTSPTNPLAASILPTTTTNPWLSGFNPPGALATGAGANAQSMHLASMAALAAEHAARGESPYFVRALNGHTQSVRAIAAHGDTLVSGSYDHTVRVWRISTGDLLHRLAGHAQKVYSVVLDHRRQRCISGSMDNLVKVWSLETGAQLFSLEGHTSLVGLLDLQRDRLVSAAADSTLRVWDPATGRCQSVLSAHTGAITCFQHDGRKVVSGSDRCLKMWDVQTGQFQRDLLRDLSGVWQVRFDERRCVAAVQRNNLTFIEVRRARQTWLEGLLIAVLGARFWCRARRRPAQGPGPAHRCRPAGQRDGGGG